MKPSLGRVPMGGPKPPGWADLSTKGPMARTRPRHHARPRRGRRPRARPTSARCPCPTRAGRRSLAELHAPRKVGWSLDPRLRGGRRARCVAICEAALQHARGAGHGDRRRRPGVRPRPGDAVAHAGDGRQRARRSDTCAAPTTGPGSTRVTSRSSTTFGAKPSGADVLAAIDACHTRQRPARRAVPPGPAAAHARPWPARSAPPGAQGTVDGEETPSWVAFTYPFNMTRSPAGTVCVGLHRGAACPSGSRWSARSTPMWRCCARWPSWRTRSRSIGSPRSEPRWYRSRPHPGRVAQLVRALPSHGRGQGFESLRAHQISPGQRA